MRVTATTKTLQGPVNRHRFLLAAFYLCVIAVAAILLTHPVSAQAKKKEDAPPKPSSVTLKTKDGLSLRAFYFPSNREKEAITVLLVHEWQGQASPYGTLVVALRDAGCAVLVPDYRGHGGSKEYIDARGEEQTFNLATMGKLDVQRIITNDLEEAKRFLKKENNKEKLNLNALVVIGVREGCVLATHWAQRDWSFAPIGSKKRGQDVKALVLISPKKILKGIALDQTLTNPAIVSLPIMLVSGKGTPEDSEAIRIHKRIEVYKKKMTRGAVTGLELKQSRASLSGPLLVKNAPDVIPAVVKFVKENVIISDDENPWINRE
ncbi:MAG: alpha/beta hydrolase [Pirellulaceae bacterium]|nr:alpha/beta hydrolase [Pirellulaceae bacterium]